MASKSTSLVFKNTAFHPVENSRHPDQIWLSAKEVSDALGYSDEKSINRIYSRNHKEFNEKMAGVVKVTTPGGEQETLTFSLRGAHLIGMFSRTANAGEFRKWVLDILDSHVETLPNNVTETLLPSEQQTLSEIAHRRAEPYGANQGKVLAEIWSRLHNKFRIAKYNQLPRTQLADAIVYVTSMELRTKPDVAPELMNSNDMNNLSRMVWLLCRDVRFESSWRHAIWRLFRRVSNQPSPKPFEVRHIPVLAEECRRVWHIVSRFHDAVQQAEKVVIKRVLHNDEDASVVLEQISAALMKAATEDAQQADGYLKRWGEDEIGNFAGRKAMMPINQAYLES